MLMLSVLCYVCVACAATAPWPVHGLWRVCVGASALRASIALHACFAQSALIFPLRLRTQGLRTERMALAEAGA